MNIFKKNKNKLFYIILGLILITPFKINAITFENPLKIVGEAPPDQATAIIVGQILRVLFGILGSIALVLIITSGFIWMTAKGNPEKIKKAQGIIVWATIGLAVIFASYTILDFVINIF